MVQNCYKKHTRYREDFTSTKLRVHYPEARGLEYFKELTILKVQECHKECTGEQNREVLH